MQLVMAGRSVSSFYWKTAPLCKHIDNFTLPWLFSKNSSDPCLWYCSALFRTWMERHLSKLLSWTTKMRCWSYSRRMRFYKVERRLNRTILHLSAICRVIVVLGFSVIIWRLFISLSRAVVYDATSDLETVRHAFLLKIDILVVYDCNIFWIILKF